MIIPEKRIKYNVIFEIEKLKLFNKKKAIKYAIAEIAKGIILSFFDFIFKLFTILMLYRKGIALKGINNVLIKTNIYIIFCSYRETYDRYVPELKIINKA